MYEVELIKSNLDMIASKIKVIKSFTELENVSIDQNDVVFLEEAVRDLGVIGSLSNALSLKAHELFCLMGGMKK